VRDRPAPCGAFPSNLLLILIYGLGDANVSDIASEGWRVFVTKVAHLIALSLSAHYASAR
jgi:hypothetical protein